MIEIDNGKIKVKVQDEEVSFALFEVVKRHTNIRVYFQMDATNEKQ